MLTLVPNTPARAELHSYKARIYQFSNNVNLHREEKMEGKRSNTQPLILIRKIKGR